MYFLIHNINYIIFSEIPHITQSLQYKTYQMNKWIYNICFRQLTFCLTFQITLISAY